MLNPFQRFTRRIIPDYLGVDIGTTSIKIAELVQGEQLPKLANYAVLETQGSLARPNQALQTSSLKLFEEETVDFLGKALERMQPKTSFAIASLPSFAAFMTVLSFPKMNQNELAKTMAYQAKQYIPLPLSEVALDWSAVGEYEDAKGNKFDQVLLISVPQEQIRKYQAIMKAVGLTMIALEVEVFGLARSAVGTDPATALIMDIGNRSTAFAVTEKGKVKFAGQSDYAGASLTQALVSSLNINPLRAEELKRERGITGTGPNYELSTIILPFLDVILSEAKRVRANYESQFPAAPKIERIVLAGGGANLLGLEQYVSKQMGIPAVKAAPILGLEFPPLLEPLLPELNPLLSLAIGLALREF